MIKKIIASVLCILAITAMQAQGEQSAPDHKKGDRKEKIERIKQDLGLSEEQASQWETIHEQHRSRMRTLKENTSMSEDEKKVQMKELRSNKNERINALLTAEQQEKWKSMKADKRGKKKGSRHHGPPPSEKPIDD